MELIKVVKNEEGNEVVSARDLHELLEIKNHFTQWFNDNKDSFEEDIDYQTIKERVNSGHTFTWKVDYAITTDMAKQLAMMSRVEKGKEVRIYFINRDKKLKEIESKNIIQLPDFNNPVLAARAWADEVEAKNNALQLAKDTQERVLELEPKAELAETFLISNDSINLGDFSKVIGWGRNNLFKQMKSDKYLMSNNIPYQRYVENGYFTLIEVPVLIGGKVEIKFQPRLNVSGQRYFQKKYGK